MVMETLFVYLIKSSGLIAVFYLAYFFMLRKETFFSGNRWFLLVGLITSVILPFVFITKIIWVEPSTTPINWSVLPVTNYTEEKTLEDYLPMLTAVAYGMGILVLLAKFAFDFYSLRMLLKGKSIERQADFKFIDTKENIAPFSYFNTIVYNSSLYNTLELENILEHEKVHSEQNHTIDVLISRLFCIVFWFNPFLWLYKKAILQNLEFIADNEASKRISDKKAYQITLLKITTHENCVAITNHFYQSLIKKRIVMLNKNQSKKWNSWKYTLVLPALVAFVFLFQIKVIAQEKVEAKPENTDVPSLPKGKEVFVNGVKVSEDYLKKLDSNEVEKSDSIDKSGKPSVPLNTIEPPRPPKAPKPPKPLKINDKDIYINGVKSNEKELSLLDQNTIDKMDVNTMENTVRITTKNEKPIIFLNGSRTFSNFKIDDIQTDQIASINVLKGKAAEEKYGEAGKNGVIEITNKSSHGKFEAESAQGKIVKGYGLKSTTENYQPNSPSDEKKETRQDKVVYGWKLSAIPATRNMKQIIVEDKNTDYKKAVIIIDGKLSNTKKMGKINPDKIARVSVRKIPESAQKQKEEAVQQYGNKALNGIIEIETKGFTNN